MWREEEEIDLRCNNKNQIKRDEDRKSSKSGDRFIMNLSLTREIDGTELLCDRPHHRCDQQGYDGGQKKKN